MIMKTKSLRFICLTVMAIIMTSITVNGINQKNNTVYEENSRKIDSQVEIDILKTDRFIIKYKNKQGKENLNKVFKHNDGTRKKSIEKINMDVILTSEKTTLKELKDAIKSEQLDSYIEYIQPDYELKITSGDPLYSSQWGIENISVKPKKIDEKYKVDNETAAEILKKFQINIDNLTRFT